MTREELLKIAKPMLFNTDMVRAILEDRKTATRRLVKSGKKSTPRYHNRDKFYGIVDHLNNDYKNWYAGFYNDADIFYIDGEKHIDACYWKAPYQPGDILYVRETWQDYIDGGYLYKADENECYENECDWRPSIHMPKEAARIFLKVKDVRVERLQEMTEEQVEKEGIHYDECPSGFTWKQRTSMVDCYTSAKGAFETLWNSTIKKSDLELYGWNANPWVWVIEFERITVE